MKRSPALPGPASLVRQAGALRRVAQEEGVGHKSEDVGVEIKVFAKAVQRQDHARHGVGAVQGRAKVFGEALVGQGAEPLEQGPVALEIGAQKPRFRPFPMHFPSTCAVFR